MTASNEYKYHVIFLYCDILLVFVSLLELVIFHDFSYLRYLPSYLTLCS